MRGQEVFLSPHMQCIGSQLHKGPYIFFYTYDQAPYPFYQPCPLVIFVIARFTSLRLPANSNLNPRCTRPTPIDPFVSHDCTLTIQQRD
jgi:hypothetical protein